MQDFIQNFFYYRQNYPIQTTLVLIAFAFQIFQFFGPRIYLPVTPGTRRILKLKKELELKLGFKTKPISKVSVTSALSLNGPIPPDFTLTGIYQEAPISIKLYNRKINRGDLKEFFTANIKDHFIGISIVVEVGHKQLKLSQDRITLNDVTSLLNRLIQL